MIEMLVVLLILSLLNLNTMKISNFSKIKDQSLSYEVQDELIDIKLKSIKNLTKECYDSKNILNYKPVCFNEKGNVNQAQNFSLLHSNQTITIHLGSGIYELK